MWQCCRCYCGYQLPNTQIKCSRDRAGFPNQTCGDGYLQSRTEWTGSSFIHACVNGTLQVSQQMGYDCSRYFWSSSRTVSIRWLMIEFRCCTTRIHISMNPSLSPSQHQTWRDGFFLPVRRYLTPAIPRFILEIAFFQSRILTAIPKLASPGVRECLRSPRLNHAQPYSS